MKPASPDHAGDPEGGASIVNVANGLTLARVICVPVLAWLLWLSTIDGDDARWWAAVVFVVASITDLLDGALARRYDLVTSFGKIADPIADKALTAVALIGLSLLGDLAWWVTIVILGREIAVTILRFWVIEHGVIPASRGGKLKTVTQMVAITMYLMVVPWAWWSTLAGIVMLVAVLLTVVTGFDYAGRALALRRRESARV